jgi:hypothetical protein
MVDLGADSVPAGCSITGGAGILPPIGRWIHGRGRGGRGVRGVTPAAASPQLRSYCSQSNVSAVQGTSVFAPKLSPSALPSQ